MFLTNDILKKYKACGKGIDIFNKIYPAGAEMRDVILNENIPDEALFWGALYLPSSEEERALLSHRMKVNNSVNVMASHNVNDSKDVRRSNNIEKSKRILNSDTIIESKFVTNSTDIKLSHNIINSHHIFKSGDVANSQHIKNSFNVANSSNITDSINILNSHHLYSSEAVYQCEDSEFVGISFGIKHSKKILFCTQISDGNSMIFNKPIDNYKFEHYWHSLCEFISDEKIQIIMGAPTISNFYSADVNNNFKIMFESMSYELRQWIKQIDNYDPYIMYTITLDPFWLE